MSINNELLTDVYMPIERQSRYGVLQGRESVETGEKREDAFKTDYYGLQDEIGASVLEERDKFASNFYDRINQLLADYSGA